MSDLTNFLRDETARLPSSPPFAFTPFCDSKDQPLPDEEQVARYRQTLSILLSVLKDVLALCGENQEYFTFVRKWLAHMVQRPEERPMCALGISGPQGIGKTSFAHVIGKLMHDSHYNDTMTMEDITGRFTGSLSTTLFGFLDEASWGGDVAGAGRLKSFITALNDRIEFKGVDSFKVPTYKRVVFASNNSYYYHADTRQHH